MPIEHVHRAVLIDDLALTVSAWRYICDRCGHRETFPDHPMPEGRSEFDASKRGWNHSCLDDEQCVCPACITARREQFAKDRPDGR
jgi:hypothetical protein